MRKIVPVFPAHAGMFRFYTGNIATGVGFPRARGDVPASPARNSQNVLFSPRTRGCSAGLLAFLPPNSVFPAHAGMFLSPLGTVGVDSGFPRARGDVPIQANGVAAAMQFSPRTRGCSGPRAMPSSTNKVFPAHAGMFQI